jgi:large subunit ribosomal protein L6e
MSSEGDAGGSRAARGGCGVWEVFGVRAGPYAVNGVPLRRVNQAYVIATSTVLDVSGVKLPAEASTDAFYVETKRAKAERRTKERSGEAAFFKAEDVPAGAKEVPEARKRIQKEVDDAILKSKSVDETIKAYLKAKFSLRSGDYPHELKF